MSGRDFTAYRSKFSRDVGPEYGKSALSALTCATVNITRGGSGIDGRTAPPRNGYAAQSRCYEDCASSWCGEFPIDERNSPSHHPRALLPIPRHFDK